MKYLLDTDISSYFLRGKNNLVNIFEEKGYQNIILSRITVAELEVLANYNPLSKINFASISHFASSIGVLDIDPTTWQIFSKIKAETLQTGNRKGDMDILIASLAKQHGLIVVTNNTAHFEGIADIENWIVP